MPSPLAIRFVELVAKYAGENFGPIEQLALRVAADRCAMYYYPVPTNGDGERASGNCLCKICGELFYDHPMDWRLLGHCGLPIVHVLCDGRRVKL